MSLFESASWLDFRKFLSDTDSEASLNTLTDNTAPKNDALSKGRSLSRTSMASQQNVYERIVLFLSTAFQETPSKDMDITEIVSRLAETLQPALSTLRAPVTDRLSHSFFFSQLAGLLSDSFIVPNSKLVTDVLESHIGHFFWNLARTTVAPFIHIQSDRLGTFSGTLAANLLGIHYFFCNSFNVNLIGDTVLRAAIDDALSSVPAEAIQSFAVYVSKDETGPWNNIQFPKSLRKREFELIFRRIPSLDGRDVMDMNQLRDMIASDEENSIKPVLIVGRLGDSCKMTDGAIN
jgi:hypothetical protein